MPDTFDINSIFSQDNGPFKASALLNDGVIDSSSMIYTGNIDSNLFSDGKNELGKMDFLRLLTVQLQYQDPFEPMDSSEFVAQLAQFSTLESTNNVEKAISSLDTSFKDSLDVQSFSALSMTNASAISMIGKSVRIVENSVKYSGIPGEEATINVHLGNSDTANVQILNQDGEVIKTLNAENKDAENSVTLTWDGKDDTGEYVQSGKYHLYVEGQEADSSLYCFIESMVEGVRYTAEGPMIKIGGKELPIGNIMDISMSGPGPTGTNGSGIGIDTNTAISLIGKTIRYTESEVSYVPATGQFKEVNVDLGDLESAVVLVKDANDRVVHSFEIEAGPGGFAKAEVDCIDYSGNGGPYTISLAGNTSAYFFSEGTVDGISTVDGIIKLRVNGITVSLSDILDISSKTYTV